MDSGVVRVYSSRRQSTLVASLETTEFIRVELSLTYVIKNKISFKETENDFYYIERDTKREIRAWIREDIFHFGIYRWKETRVGDIADKMISIDINLQTNEMTSLRKENEKVNVKLFKEAAWLVKEEMIRFRN